MRVVVLALLLFSFFSSFGTTITGTAKAYANETIRLIFYTELFSQQPILVDEVKITNEGDFQFNYDVKSTRLVALKIKDYRSNFYISPNSTYVVSLGKYDPKSAPPLSKDKYLPANLLREDEMQINRAIGKLNVDLDSFEQKNYLAFLKNQAQPLVKAFSTSLTKRELYAKSPFFKKYVNGSIGSLMHKAKFSNKEVYEGYLSSSIDYQNIGYVNLVNDFYNKWFNRYSLTSDYKKLKDNVSNGKYEALNAFLQTNDFLKNDTLRELIATKELFRLAVEDNTIDPVSVDKMLSIISKSGVTKENRQIAKHYLSRLRKLGIGAEAPNFLLPDVLSNAVQLKDFRGKYVYVDFWATWCKPCLKSMQVMKQLYPKYKDNVEFVSINIDDRKRRFDKHMENYNYPWTILYAGSNEELKDAYDVVVIPLYYLIDPNGKLVQAPAFSPGGGIERTFDKLFNSETKEEIKIWDWNFDPKNPNK